jgi:nucleoside-diphosphate-sugar epimerase
VEGMLSLAQCKEAIGEVINIGSGREVAISELVEMFSNIVQFEIEVTTDEKRLRPPNSEVQRLIADNSKMHSLTEWKSAVSLEKGLERTYRWIANNLDCFNHAQYAK